MAKPEVVEATAAYERLSPRHRHFVDWYVGCGANGAAAARAVGYKGPHPQIRAYRLLQRPLIRAAIAERSAPSTLDRHNIAAQTLKVLNAIATSDFRRVFGPHGQPLPLEQIDEGTRLALKEYTVETFTLPGGGTRQRIRVEMQDKLKAVDALGRMQRLW